MFKYAGHEITLGDVPDEISLSIAISSCPFRCEGCHSAALREDIGIPLTEEELTRLIQSSSGATVVTFLGGTHDGIALKRSLNLVRSKGLKTCLYTGASKVSKSYLPLLDYLKVGPYVESLGPLDSPTTNQVFYKVTLDGDSYTLTDVTYLFRRTPNNASK